VTTITNFGTLAATVMLNLPALSHVEWDSISVAIGYNDSI